MIANALNTFSIAAVLLSIVFLILSLYLNWLKPVISFIVVVAFLLLLGVITPKEALSGFANEQLATIVLLLILSDMLRKSALLNKVYDQLFNRANTGKWLIARMIIFLAPASALLNNTPLVAMLLPYVYKWSEKKKVALSKVLMPLSYITILGGCATLIGTSTNLIVNGLAVDAGFESLSIFDFTPLGATMIILGGLYIVFFSAYLLPDKQSAGNSFDLQKREFFIEMRVQDQSPLHGKTIEQAGLRKLDNVYLFEIYRKGETIRPVSPKTQLLSGDKLIFTGNTDAVNFLKQPIEGLSLPKKCDLPDGDQLSMIEVVVAHNSPLTDKKVKDTNFRGKFDAAIVALHRNGERLSGKIGDFVLQPGDVLLLLAGNDFYNRTAGNPSFYVLSVKEEEIAPPPYKTIILFIGLVLSIGISSIWGIPLMLCLCVLLAYSLVFEVIPASEIRKGVDFNLIMLMTLGLAIGKGMTNSGAAELVASQSIRWVQNFPTPLLIFTLFMITNVFSAYVTNKAAVAILFPVSMALAHSLSLPYQPFVLVVAFGAAASFITPIGYQTNLMVYGPGGYNFKDFMRFGLPLTTLYAIAAAAILSWQFRLF